MTALHPTEKQKVLSFVFSSESVSEGHPDKVADQISDAILDAHLARDHFSRVACETLVTKNKAILAGEIATHHKLSKDEIETLVRNTIKGIGYTHGDKGFDHNCEIINLLHKQEPALNQNEGAGDQGLMFGYACNQTKELMPIPVLLAHRILQNLGKARKEMVIPCLLPDAKSQVSFKFVNRQPVELPTVIVSTHHHELDESGFRDMRQQVMDLVVKPSIAEIEESSARYFDANKCDIKINPLGMWTDGGPAADTGLTGRKIIVDTYGGWAQHGGGAFSGKDATKVDRSAAYMARHIAKSIVASGMADECLLQFGFVIGDEKPVSLMIDTFGSGKIADAEIEKMVDVNFDLTVKGIIEYLDLRKPIYGPSAAYGHFGRAECNFSWEKTKLLNW